MIELVNGIIDKLIQVGWRLLDLPTYALALLALPLVILGLRLARERGKLVGFLIFSVVVLPMLIALWADAHLSAQRTEIAGLQRRYMRALGWLDQEPARANPNSDEPLWGDFEVSQRRLDPAITLWILRRADPKAVAFCVCVDLTNPSVELVITPKLLEQKTLTSEFGMRNGCIAAINGEAGEGPEQGSGFGEWVGNWVVQGVPVMLKDTAQRPFLSFDTNNRARYWPAAEVVPRMTEGMYNALWGRYDVLVEGNVIEFEDRRSYSRTLMGIDAQGTTLYLMVVDGKRPSHSVGLTYTEAAGILKQLGAWDAMACDHGGSSAMYAEPMRGLINVPADNQAVERPVYTHFGVRVVSGPPGTRSPADLRR